MEPFLAAFGIEPGDPVYLAPEERIVVRQSPLSLDLAVHVPSS
jgi:hypothetical protein